MSKKRARQTSTPIKEQENEEEKSFESQKMRFKFNGY